MWCNVIYVHIYIYIYIHRINDVLRLQYIYRAHLHIYNTCTRRDLKGKFVFLQGGDWFPRNFSRLMRLQVKQQVLFCVDHPLVLAADMDKWGPAIAMAKGWYSFFSSASTQKCKVKVHKFIKHPAQILPIWPVIWGYNSLMGVDGCFERRGSRFLGCFFRDVPAMFQDRE